MPENGWVSGSSKSLPIYTSNSVRQLANENAQYLCFPPSFDLPEVIPVLGCQVWIMSGRIGKEAHALQTLFMYRIVPNTSLRTPPRNFNISERAKLECLIYFLTAAFSVIHHSSPSPLYHAAEKERRDRNSKANPEGDEKRVQEKAQAAQAGPHSRRGRWLLDSPYTRHIYFPPVFWTRFPEVSIVLINADSLKITLFFQAHSDIQEYEVKVSHPARRNKSG